MVNTLVSRLRKQSVAVGYRLSTKITEVKLCGHDAGFLGAFAKLRKLTLSFFTSVCPVCSSSWNNSAPCGRIFMKFYISVVFWKSVKKSFVKIWQEWRVLYMKRNIHFFLSYLAELSLEWEIVEKIKTHFMSNSFFLRNSCCLSDNVEKYCRAGQPQMTIWHLRLHAGKLASA
jgi:hypothetical protein